MHHSLLRVMSAIEYVAGPVIWENPDYVSPNDLRAAEKKQVWRTTVQMTRNTLNVLYVPNRIGMCRHVA